MHRFLLIADKPGRVIDSAEDLNAARGKVHAHARAHDTIKVVEIKATYITHAVAREVQDEGNVLRLSPPSGGVHA